jgi:hypothetical protein
MRIRDPNAIPGARPAAPLNVAKGRNTSVKAKAISEHIFNIVRTDRFEIGIMGALCYNHYGLALSNLAVLNCTEISCMRKDHHAQGRTR